MGSFRTLMILMTLGAWGAATEGSPLEDPATSAAARPALPRPAGDYLKAGASLYNQSKYDKAAQYLKVANDYRDNLSRDEQAVLDQYLKELAKAKGSTDSSVAPASAETAVDSRYSDRSSAVSAARTGAVDQTAAADPAKKAQSLIAQAREAYVQHRYEDARQMALEANDLGVKFRPEQDSPAKVLADIQKVQTDPAARISTTDAKQKARWLLHESYEAMKKGEYDVAETKINQARAMNVHWGLFDDTPAKASKELEKVRPKMAKTGAGSPKGDKRAAKTKLHEARQMIEMGKFEEAEAVALEVNSWGLSYGFVEDSPAKVASAARALRQRDAIRNGDPKHQPTQSVYDVMVKESRELMASGKLDAAEAKARQAQRLNVVPTVTSDRAESVLSEIEVKRTELGASPGRTMAMSPSVKAELEADSLLAKGDKQAATAKFAEAERLSANEIGSSVAAPAQAGVVDVNVALTRNTQTQQPGQAAPVEPAGALDAPVAPPEAAPAAAPENVPPPEAAPDGDAPKTASEGDQLLSQAKQLLQAGNFPAAKQYAEKVKNGKYGLEGQAEEMLAQISVSEQAAGYKLYEAAIDALRKGDSGHAKALLSEIVNSSLAVDETLSQKVQDLLLKLPRDEAGKAKVGLDSGMTSEDPRVVAAQQMNAEVGAKVAEARRLLDTDPDKAIAVLQGAMATVKASNLDELAKRTMARRVEVAIELAKKEKLSFDRKMEDKQYRAEIEAKRLRIMEASKIKEQKYHELIDKANEALAMGKYAEAEAFAKQAELVDPNDPTAPALVYKAKFTRRYKTDLENRDAKENGMVSMLQGVDAAMNVDPMLDANGIVMAKNFGDITRMRREGMRRLEVQKDPKTLQIEAKLSDRVSLNIDKQPLNEAVTYLQNYTGLNIVLDPKALSDEGLAPTSPVSLTAADIKLKSALKLLLQPLGLTYKITDEVLLITSPQINADDMITRVYYVGDLLMPLTQNTKGLINPNDGGDASAVVPSTPNGAVGVGAAVEPPGMPPRLIGEGNQAAPSSGDPNVRGEGRAGGRPDVDMSPLIRLISRSVAPGTWKVYEDGRETTAAYGMGGGLGGDADANAANIPPGSITPFFLNISLIIRHTAEVHEDIQDLLRQLRRLQDLQISIEVRFISVEDSFFEQIGVDFDMNIHSNVPGRKSSFAVPIPGLLSSLLTTTGTTTGTTGTGTTGTGTTGTGSTGTGSTGAGSTGSTGSGTTSGGTGGTGGLGGTGSVGGAGAGGGLGGGSTTTGQGTGSVTPAVAYNPFRDYSFGNRQPLVVGLNAGGIGNFSSNSDLPFIQQSAQLITPFNATPGAGGTFGVAFLSDLEAYLFVTAAQGDQRNNIVQAPKVTTFNGAGASVRNNVTRYYVQNQIPIVGFGAVAFQPVIGTIPDGVTLFVTPVVSADRRYVRMTLAPFFISFQGFQTFPTAAAVGGGGLGGGATSITTTIQLPIVGITTIATTVTVPDGGTVLLGGVKTMREQRIEYGVPVLSKIPMINRLFRNIGVGRDTTSLMMMVTPRIIILEEEEERLGIPTVPF